MNLRVWWIKLTLRLLFSFGKVPLCLFCFSGKGSSQLRIHVWELPKMGLCGQAWHSSVFYFFGSWDSRRDPLAEFVHRLVAQRKHLGFRA